MAKTRFPAISVVMPVYNAQAFLRQAIDSILSQTFKEFEFIIIDDGSTDNTWQLLKAYQQKSHKIHLLRNRNNLGPSASVNRALRVARGKYIARMDADDIATIDRLEKQLAFLQQHEHVVAVGGQIMLIDRFGNAIGIRKFPLTHEKIYLYTFCFTGIYQPAMMIARHRLPKRFSFYKETTRVAEETELLFRLFQYGSVANLPDTLLCYRLHTENMSLRNVRKTFFSTLYVRLQAIIRYAYRPHVSGVFVTLIQTFLVLLLPQKGVLFLYRKIRDEKYTSSLPPTRSSLPSHSSLAITSV